MYTEWNLQGQTLRETESLFLLRACVLLVLLTSNLFSFMFTALTTQGSYTAGVQYFLPVYPSLNRKKTPHNYDGVSPQWGTAD